MRKITHLFVCGCLLGLLIADRAICENSSGSKTSSPFLRITKDKNKKMISLDTSIVRYVPASGKQLVVDLIGAVHIGDKSYYEQLNKAFTDYDVVLYELVAPQGTRIPRGGQTSNGNPVSLLQRMAKSMLDLESQMTWIDYTKSNFVHADMSPQEISKKMRDRGETSLTVFLSAMSDVMKQANLQQQQFSRNSNKNQIDISPLSLLTGGNSSQELKQFMAEQFANSGESGISLGPTLDRMLIADRNAATMKVFNKELAKGRKRIAIFYGAAHMTDFDRRLREDFALVRDSEKWLVAWDLTKPDVRDPSENNPLGALFRLLAE